MAKHYIFNVERETILDKISQLQPLNYNQFRWWRRFDTLNKPLHKYSNLLDKIQNGDYEFSHYYWQAKYAELEMDDIHHETYPDAALYNEKTSIHGARRQRLWDDFEKDEQEKLQQIEKDFYLEFKMSRKQVKEEMEEFGGTLENFYHYCNKQFGTRQEKLQTRGRPRKVI
jgi:hypothetical protein